MNFVDKLILRFSDNPLKTTTSFCLAKLVLLGLLALPYLYFLPQAQNIFSPATLESKKEWISTKFEILYFLMGAEEFMRFPQTLAQGKLNLGSWHGHQEIFYAHPGPLKEVKLSFEMDENSFFYVLLKKNSGDVQALRLSRHPDYPSAWIEADRLGKFTKESHLELLLNSSLHSLEMKIEERKVSLIIDHFQKDVEMSMSENLTFGLRGSANNSYIDDLKLSFAGNPPLSVSENFSTGPAWSIVFLITAFIMGLTSLLLSSRFKQKDFIYAFITTHFVLYLILGLGLWTLQKEASKYPEGIKLNAVLGFLEPQKAPLREEDSEAHYYQAAFQKIFADTGFDYTSSERRIIFLGQSQTWGAGVDRAEDRWTEQICSWIKKQLFPRKLPRCLNAGVSGATSESIATYWMQNAQNLRPHLSIFNISYNDPDYEDFEKNLRQILDFNRLHKIGTLLMIESYARETWEHDAKQQLMLAMASEYHVPIIDPSKMFVEKKGSGWIWWDSIHLTHYGQTLLADYVNNSPIFSKLMLELNK